MVAHEQRDALDPQHLRPDDRRHGARTRASRSIRRGSGAGGSGEPRSRHGSLASQPLFLPADAGRSRPPAQAAAGLLRLGHDSSTVSAREASFGRRLCRQQLHEQVSFDSCSRPPCRTVERTDNSSSASHTPASQRPRRLGRRDKRRLTVEARPIRLTSAPAIDLRPIQAATLPRRNAGRSCPAGRVLAHPQRWATLARRWRDAPNHAERMTTDHPAREHAASTFWQPTRARRSGATGIDFDVDSIRSRSGGEDAVTYT